MFGYILLSVDVFQTEQVLVAFCSFYSIESSSPWLQLSFSIVLLTVFIHVLVILFIELNRASLSCMLFWSFYQFSHLFIKVRSRGMGVPLTHVIMCCIVLGSPIIMVQIGWISVEMIIVSADFICLCICSCGGVVVGCYSFYRIVFLRVKLDMGFSHICLGLILLLVQNLLILLYNIVSRLIAHLIIILLQGIQISGLFGNFRYLSLLFLLLIEHKQTELILWFLLGILVAEGWEFIIKLRKWLVVFALVVGFVLRLEIGRRWGGFDKAWLSVFWYSHFVIVIWISSSFIIVFKVVQKLDY